jgi:hypothetical protein
LRATCHAALATIEHDVMRVEVVETALEEAPDTLRPSGAEIADRGRALEAELADLEQTIARDARGRGSRSGNPVGIGPMCFLPNGW